MKKLILILLLIVSSISIYAQDSNFFKTINLEVKKYNFNTKQWPAWNNKNIQDFNILISLTTNKVTFYVEGEPAIFFITKATKQYDSEVDSDDLILDCRDNDNNYYLITFVRYLNMSLMQLYISTSDTRVKYDIIRL